MISCQHKCRHQGHNQPKASENDHRGSELEPYFGPILTTWSASPQALSRLLVVTSINIMPVSTTQCLIRLLWQVIVTVDESGLCCCVPRYYTCDVCRMRLIPFACWCSLWIIKGRRKTWHRTEEWKQRTRDTRCTNNTPRAEKSNMVSHSLRLLHV